MTDIVKRLAKCAAVSEIVGDNPEIYYDAVHEIETLRHDIMISRSHPENEAIRRETVKWQQAANKSLSDLQRENDALRAENEKLRLELDMQQATILVPSQKDDQLRIKSLDAALKEALDEAAQLRRAMHDIYEVYAGIDGYLFDESKAYREQQFKAMADIAAEHKK